MIMKETKEKMTFLEWVDNIWYHYKWFIVVGFCALIMFGVAMFQQCSKVEPDAFVYYVGKAGPSAEGIHNFCSDLQDIMPRDFNGDGKKQVDYKEDIFVMYTPDTQTPNSGSQIYNETKQMNIIQSFNIELGMGECIIYIMEPNLFKGNLDYIKPLNEVLGYEHKEAVEGKGIRISNLRAYYKTALGDFPSDCIICIRQKRDGDDKDFYQANIETFKALVEYK